MNRSRLIRVLGIFLAGGVALSIGNRPPLKAGLAPTSIAVAATGGAFGGGNGEELAHTPVVHLAAEPMSVEATKTWLKLQEKVAVHFPTDTPLEDVKKFYQEVTAEKDDPASGIAIYFDPEGLEDADRTMGSTVVLDIKAVPLATSLKLLLAQVKLTYHIQNDGILVVTSRAGEGSPADANRLILDNLTALRAEVRSLREELQSLKAAPTSAPATPAQPQPPARINPVGGGGGGMGGGFR